VKHIFILLISLLALFSSCRCHKNTINSKNIYTLEENATLKFTDNYDIGFNKTNEYAIVSKSFKEITQSIPDLVFFIYSKNSKEVIFTDTLKAGDVYWANEFEIIANSRTQKAESIRKQYIYNVKTRKIEKR